MRWLAFAARVFLGGGFLFFGLNYFLKVMATPPPPTEAAGNYLGLLGNCGYLAFVKGLEVVGGALVLSGRYTPVGLVAVTPVAVNVALFEVYFAGTVGPGTILTGLSALLIAYYWSPHFANVFAPAEFV